MKDFSRVLLIVANAGSGKTYRLVTRCLELLARGEAPDRILALTFTRKAAAEFLQKLFGRLSAAASDPAALARLRTEVGLPDLDSERCIAWLRHLTAALPRLSMGTMDGFFGRILRSFPFELGLGREPRLLDEAAMEEHRRLAVDRLFAAAAENSEGLDQIVELLRRESRNRSDRSVFDTMESAARSLQQTFMETPPDMAWGDTTRIWPDGSGVLAAGTVEEAARELQDEIAATQPQIGSKARAQWEAWFELARAHRPPRRMDPELDKFLQTKLAGGSADAQTGELYVPVGNKREDRLYLRGRLPELRENLRRALVKLEVEARLESTRALHALLARYEKVYDIAVRETGALTFSDITNFLAAGAREDWRRDLDYRLDGRHDHWLLDEFQDTSRAQWRILEPLADEIIQDTSDARTFFYVGDTKQAIYGWRGGDARLFWEIRDHYNRGRTAAVREEKLRISHRSSRAIVRAVGAVFAPAVLEQQADEFRFPDKTIAAWDQAWVEHQAADDAPEGYVQLQIVEPQDAEESKDDALARHVIDILCQVKPLERGLDCAILVRTNDELARYVAVLKTAGIPAAAEGKVNPCLVSPAGISLLSLLRFIAAPADVVSRAHAELSPWKKIIGPDTETFAEAARLRAAREGFGPTVREWTQLAVDAGLISDGELEPFFAAAADFDARTAAAGNWHGFVRFIVHRTLDENETPGAVRVMTIHQAKGLGIDMVILPELGGKAMSEFRDDGNIALHRDDQGNVKWGLALPKKDFCDADAVLKEAREEMRTRQTYGELCVLYVAMTRAKKALYCLAARGRNDKNAGNLLEKTFPGDGDIREEGDAKWFEDYALTDESVAAAPEEPVPLVAPGSSHAAVPSRIAHQTADTILSGSEARQLGNEVHRLLAEVEWIDGAIPSMPGEGKAVRAVLAFLAGAEAGEVFARPDKPLLLWREKSFAVEIDGEITSGTFDRVHVFLQDNGEPVSAEIFDFKTDTDPNAIGQRYAKQMESYRHAAARLLGISSKAVRTRLVPIPVGE